MDQAALDRHETFTVLLYMMHKYKKKKKEKTVAITDSGVRPECLQENSNHLNRKRRLCAIVDVGLLLLVELSIALS